LKILFSVLKESLNSITTVQETVNLSKDARLIKKYHGAFYQRYLTSSRCSLSLRGGIGCLALCDKLQIEKQQDQLLTAQSPIAPWACAERYADVIADDCTQYN